jgi:hypothetical protein
LGQAPLIEDYRAADDYFQQLSSEAKLVKNLSTVFPDENLLEDLLGDNPALYSAGIGTAKCAPYEIDLLNQVPVRSPPYRYAPRELNILKGLIEDLLTKGVIRPTKSPYASSASLVPKAGGDFAHGGRLPLG